MAVIIDSFSDAMNQGNFLIKTIIYSLPVFVCANFYVANNMVALYLFGIPTVILLLGLLSIGIYNISNNKKEILTFNIIALLGTIVKLFFAIGFYALILFIIGFLFLSFVKIPVEDKYVQIFYKCFVIFFLFSVGFTPYLAFSKKLKVKDAYKLSLFKETVVQVLITLLFTIPQFLIVNAILVGSMWYVLFVLGMPPTTPIFTFFCSFIVVLNVSALSSYMAQVAYTCIQGEDEDYLDKYYIKGKTLKKE